MEGSVGLSYVLYLYVLSVLIFLACNKLVFL